MVGPSGMPPIKPVNPPNLHPTMNNMPSTVQSNSSSNSNTAPSTEKREKKGLAIIDPDTGEAISFSKGSSDTAAVDEKTASTPEPLKGLSDFDFAPRKNEAMAILSPPESPAKELEQNLDKFEDLPKVSILEKVEEALTAKPSAETSEGQDKTENTQEDSASVETVEDEQEPIQEEKQVDVPVEKAVTEQITDVAAAHPSGEEPEEKPAAETEEAARASGVSGMPGAGADNFPFSPSPATQNPADVPPRMLEREDAVAVADVQFAGFSTEDKTTEKPAATALRPPFRPRFDRYSDEASTPVSTMSLKPVAPVTKSESAPVEKSSKTSVDELEDRESESKSLVTPFSYDTAAIPQATVNGERDPSVSRYSYPKAFIMSLRATCTVLLETMSKEITEIIASEVDDKDLSHSSVIGPGSDRDWNKKRSRNSESSKSLISGGSSRGIGRLAPAPAGQGAPRPRTGMYGQQAPSSRKSYTGRGSRRTQPAFIDASGKTNQQLLKLDKIPNHQLKLSITPNAWKPKQKGPNGPNQLEEVRQQVRSILNKLTETKFVTLTEKLIAVVKDFGDKVNLLTEVVVDIFAKALSEKHFASMYCALCVEMDKNLQTVQNAVIDANGKAVMKEVTFKRLLLNKCQEEFEKGASAIDTTNKSDQQIAEEKASQKGRMLGNIRFIGELYMQEMLTEKIMHLCVQHLLSQTEPPDEDVECVCDLLTTIGQKLDHPKAKKHMDIYFLRLQAISGTTNRENRIKFMCRDVQDLRKNMWKPRRTLEKAKTLSEIRSESDNRGRSASVHGDARRAPGSQQYLYNPRDSRSNSGSMSGSSGRPMGAGLARGAQSKSSKGTVVSRREDRFSNFSKEKQTAAESANGSSRRSSSNSKDADKDRDKEREHRDKDHKRKSKDETLSSSSSSSSTRDRSRDTGDRDRRDRDRDNRDRRRRCGDEKEDRPRRRDRDRDEDRDRARDRDRCNPWLLFLCSCDCINV